ncbi:50S ribosomal protein L11 methyltransferase [bacterium]|nr:50S ribosomal protein L11 methyltransferase [Akkermansiaceae bacterium]MDB4257689.1 50S ribosomal protein L11 methyltransferase [bacterium]MDB4295368.1 50S ribosomal protein L11 methyltransferase [Akkermansiaceae bacterium]MDB4300449.1 50S ribosomal protein L11 methyltransferase [bacterium]MDB4323206.1 50S ribosomal protein L11 methyltransferase [Akkermansiaceae bacterium]
MAIEISYRDLWNHGSMLRDEVRCKAFRDALEEVVTPDSVVLDIGAGTGILSIFAAQAGAKQVYAVERSPVAQAAKEIISRNGLSDRITVIQGEMETLELPEKVDVIVSEWLGGYGVDENLLPIVIQARDRWLKPGGVMIPGTTTSWMVPAYDDYLQEEIEFYDSQPYGVDLSLVSEDSQRRTGPSCHHVRPEDLACEAELMWTVNSHTCTEAESSGTFEAKLEFISTCEGEINVLAAWFETKSAKTVELSNAPHCPDTHWGRTVFPIGKTIHVERGTVIKVHFIHEPHGKGHSNAKWSVEIDDYRFQSEDTTLLTTTFS